MKSIVKLIIVVTLHLLTVAGNAQNINVNTGEDFSIIKPIYEFIPVDFTRLTGGILEDRCTKNIENLYLKIDEDELSQVFKETHNSEYYAEPEFVGHYLKSGPLIYKTSGKEEVLKKNGEIVESIIAGQREDGYLGTYEKGLEYEGFSIWNQNFVIKGLLANYQLTGNKKALDAAIRSADNVALSFMNKDTVNILRTTFNQGIQHVTVLEEITHLYQLTGKKLYLDFAHYIINKMEDSTIKVISIPNDPKCSDIINSISCTKGIELFKVYLGVLGMYRITGEEKYLSAARNYWRGLQSTQIGVTGNGTLREYWNTIGNTPIETDTQEGWGSLNPNENCVAMGWMKFSAELALFSGESKYFDELEKTLHNHLLGSQAGDGSDFSYYQGTIGHKIHRTREGLYSCCRYRGMRILSYLPGYVYMQSGNEVVVNLFTSSVTTANINNVNINIEQNTVYPKNGYVSFSIKPEKEVGFKLLIRKPGWCKNASVIVDGNEKKCEIQNGYLVINNDWKTSGHKVELNLEISAAFIYATIANTERAAVTYGPLLLAFDSRYGTPVNSTMIRKMNKPLLTNITNNSELIPQVKFLIDGKIDGIDQKITLVDYATAGSINPATDEFRVWIPSFE